MKIISIIALIISVLVTTTYIFFPEVSLNIADPLISNINGIDKNNCLERVEKDNPKFLSEWEKSTGNDFSKNSYINLCKFSNNLWYLSFKYNIGNIALEETVKYFNGKVKYVIVDIQDSEVNGYFLAVNN